MLREIVVTQYADRALQVPVPSDLRWGANNSQLAPSARKSFIYNRFLRPLFCPSYMRCDDYVSIVQMCFLVSPVFMLCSPQIHEVTCDTGRCFLLQRVMIRS